MSKRSVVLGALAIVIAGIGYWLISPLFITREVHESMDELLRMAGVEQAPAMLQPEAAPLPQPNLTMTPPAGKDPMTESKGPTSPPPAPVPAVETVATGQFEGQAQHDGAGTAKLVKIGDKFFVRFEDDFDVTNGPDLFVGFGKDGEYTTQLAPLKGNVGSQNYEVPAEINAAAFNEIWVWCRAFSVPFARAVLN